MKTMTNGYSHRQEIVRIKKLEDEATRLGLKPVERNLFINEAKLVDSSEGVRMYDRRKEGSYHSISTSIVYDGVLDKETASQIGKVAVGTPGSLGAIVVYYANAKGAVLGLVPKDDYYEQIANGQISVEIEGDGELAEKAVKEIKSILEKARQNKLTPASQPAP